VSYKALGIKKMKNNLKINNELIDQYKISNIENVQTVTSGEISTNIEIVDILDKKIIFFQNGNKKSAYFYKSLNETFVDLEGEQFILSKNKKSLSKTSGDGDGQLLSPMPGKILQVLVNAHDNVKAGQSLIVMEAMKMEHTIKAGFDGKVEKIFFNEGDLVEGDVELISLSSDEKE
tara:strand:+ start:789 stop:1316 length:528 start_codon:yes stop_codon:yes gene_type:complete